MVEDIKTLLCAAVKLENRYIEEWVRFYKEIGIDKIVIFDNNDTNGEKITDVPYVKQLADEGYIDVYLQPDKMGIQTAQFTECYNMYHKEYDWLMFFDIDEYLMIEDGKNIKEYLTQEKFNRFDMIHVQWRLFDDNDLIHVENGDYSLVKRFTRSINVKNLLGENVNALYQSYCYHKTIIRGRKYRKIRFYSGNTHTPEKKFSDPNLLCCDANGKESDPFLAAHKPLDKSEAWLNHYICKTAEEYVDNKLVRLCGSMVNRNMEEGRVNLNLFFKYNTITYEKIKYFEEACPDKCDLLFSKLNKCYHRYIYDENKSMIHRCQVDEFGEKLFY